MTPSQRKVEPSTLTSRQQIEVEQSVSDCFRTAQLQPEFTSSSSNVHDRVPLTRRLHIDYCLRSLELLPSSYRSLESSRPWLLYWTLHSLDLLRETEFLNNKDKTDDDKQQHDDESARHFVTRQTHRCMRLLEICQNNSKEQTNRHTSQSSSSSSSSLGGYAGSPGQLSHLATSYAAVCSIAILAHLTSIKQASSSTSTPPFTDIFASIDRHSMYAFLLRMKHHEAGAFSVCEDGECDTRATYTALCIASLLNLLTPQLTHKSSHFLLSCQTFEGGFGGDPSCEAHGGYTFCAFASLIMIDSVHELTNRKESDVTLIRRSKWQQLTSWVSRRQMSFEGGFQGRTNKLVDGCYSWWQGGMFKLFDLCQSQQLLIHPDKRTSSPPASSVVDYSTLFDSSALRRYILECCQQSSGGLRDKPGKFADLYHTCYCLSGLAITQTHHQIVDLIDKQPTKRHHIQSIDSSQDSNDDSDINSPLSNDQDAEDDSDLNFKMPEVNPIYNVRADYIDSMLRYFAQQPAIT